MAAHAVSIAAVRGALDVLDFSVADKGVVAFGPFQLDAGRRHLTRSGEVIKLPAKQFDTLLYFVANPNRVIEKDELLAAVWPGRNVGESSLTPTIFLLRRALQADQTERYMITAPGRGYRFVVGIVRLPEVSPGGMVSAASVQPAGTARTSRAAVLVERYPRWAPLAGVIGTLLMLCVRL